MTSICIGEDKGGLYLFDRDLNDIDTADNVA